MIFKEIRQSISVPGMILMPQCLGSSREEMCLSYDSIMRRKWKLPFHLFHSPPKTSSLPSFWSVSDLLSPLSCSCIFRVHLFPGNSLPDMKVRWQRNQEKSFYASDKRSDDDRTTKGEERKGKKRWQQKHPVTRQCHSISCRFTWCFVCLSILFFVASSSFPFFHVQHLNFFAPSTSSS